MPKHQHFPFFPEAWKGDEGLKLCSLAARGLWIEMMCTMHFGDPYGHLTTTQGMPIKSAAAIARLVSEDAKIVSQLLGELEANGVLSKTPDGVLFSRRMVRDHGTRQQWAARQNRSRQTRDNGVTTGQGHGDVTAMSRGSHAESHAEVTPLSHSNGNGNGNGNTDSANAESRGKANASPPLSKKTGASARVRPEETSGPSFDAEIEAEVVSLIALMAGENATGTIAASRIANERREIERRIVALGRDAMLYGLREAVRHEATGVMYAVKCAKSFKPGPALLAPSAHRNGHASSSPGNIPREHRDGGWVK